MKYIDEKRRELTERNRNGRTLVIYGAGANLEHTLHVLDNPIDCIVVDKRHEEFAKELSQKGSVKRPDILDGQRENYYVLVSIYKEYPEIRKLLEEFGYEAGKDYCYLSIDIEPVMEEKPENYSDIFGNRIIGNLNGAKVRFLGRDSIIKVQEGFQGQGLSIDVKSDVILEVGTNVKASQEMQWVFESNTKCRIGNDCRWRAAGGKVWLSGVGAECYIGDKVSFGERNRLIISARTKLTIGEDSLFSRFITVLTNDGHPIYDLTTGECVNYRTGKERKIIIHDHVWVGEGCMILYNTEVGTGSVIGAKSVVKGRFPNNCMIAGHMAKVIRENIAWSHKWLNNGLDDLNEDWRQMTNHS